MRVLRSMAGPEGLVNFDEGSGRTVACHTEEARPSGVFFRKGGADIAFYIAKGDLVLQIGTELFSLASPTLRIRYGHDFDAGQTEFCVEDGVRALTLRYLAWWAEIGLQPEQIRFQPEEDEHEDYLAFIHEITRDPARQEGLFDAWRQ